MNATSKPQYPPNPKALRSPSKPPAATSGVLKVTTDIKDSLVQEVELIPPTKQCTTCGRTLPATKEYFYGHPGTRDKLEGRCKNCNKLRKKTGVRSITSPPVPPPPAIEEVMPVGAKVTLGNNVTPQRIDVEARGAAIQQAVATAEIIAAVSLLLGMDRVQCDAVISMVQAFHTTMEK